MGTPVMSRRESRRTMNQSVTPTQAVHMSVTPAQGLHKSVTPTQGLQMAVAPRRGNPKQGIPIMTGISNLMNRSFLLLIISSFMMVHVSGVLTLEGTYAELHGAPESRKDALEKLDNYVKMNT